MNKTILFVSLFSILLFLILGGIMSKTNGSQATLSDVLSPTPIQLDAEKLMSTVNDWRYSQGFQPYTKNETVCNFANIRVSEIQSDYSHNGFLKRINNQSFNFPYKDLGENLENDYQNPQAALDAWLNSPEHKKNLIKNYRYSCIQCLNNYCVQIFANF